MRRFSFPCDPVDTVDGEYINRLHYDVLLADVARLVEAAKGIFGVPDCTSQWECFEKSIAAVEARMKEAE